jgi:hypothetical protein
LEDLSQVEVVLLQDVMGFKLASLQLPPSKRGDKVKVPLWLARLLHERGVAGIDVDNELVWLGRIHWREKVQPPQEALSLSSLPRDFYPRVLNILHALHAFYDDPVVRQRLGQAENFFRDIVSRRLHVITEMARLETTDLSIQERLTLEERCLLDQLRERVSDWMVEVSKGRFAYGEG